MYVRVEIYEQVVCVLNFIQYLQVSWLEFLPFRASSLEILKTLDFFYLKHMPKI